MSFSRRAFLSTFLKGAGCFAVAASFPAAAPRLSAGAPREENAPGAGYHFPQGLASGDPTPHAVVLWTRVAPAAAATADAATGEEAKGGGGAPVRLTLQVSEGPAFETVVAERALTATAASDHTVRVVVDELAPGTTYFYRFTAPDGSRPPHTGRTCTAPAPEAEGAVRFAFASCQAYEAGHFGAYRLLIAEDEAARAAGNEAAQVDFVLHLGDFIYEALGYGDARSVAPFPDGGTHGEDGAAHARTLADYRHLYKTYLADPDLQAARARFPFVCIWDDHEFTNDAWQGAATYDTGADPAQARKVAANRAWFEFIPALLSGHPGAAGVASEARDFDAADVRAVPFGSFSEDGLNQEPNNRAALETLTIYRNFRWGRHLALVLTDTRSYRTPHPVPPEINQQLSGTDRYLSPLRIVEVFDAGRTARGGDPPATVPFAGNEIPNPRRESPPGTMLGAKQKRWWKEAMRGSEATWKVWGHSVPTMPMRIDLGALSAEAETVVFTTDTWDGYLTERRELMDFVAEENLANVLSLSGDNHNSFAGVLQQGYGADDDGGGAPAGRAVGAEFSICGISSPSVFSALAAAVDEGEPLRPIVTYDARRFGGTDARQEALNMTFLHGTRASAVAAQTGDVERALAAAREAPVNAHLRYVDSNAYGLGLVTVTEGEVETDLLTTRPPLEAREEGSAPPALLRRATFSLATWAPGEEPPALRGPRIEGVPPFPLQAAGETAENQE